MARGRKVKPYRIIGAFDTETTNYRKLENVNAFPILFQLGLLDCSLDRVTSDNVEQHTNMYMYRHAIEFYSKLDELLQIQFDYVPVIVCHNLSFDMYTIAPWLNSHDCRVLAKSRQKPITFTILDDNGNTRLVLWDTLVFSQQSLESMGNDCGYPKAVGKWDYDLVRTPETPLNDDEIKYASHDVYALLAWLAWWLKRNPDIEPEKLALNVVTKTGVVRERQKKRFDQIKGNGCKQNIGRYAHYLNQKQMPKSDDELYTMHACTRGGFTFCSSVNASVPFDLVDTSKIVAGFDATSQHPAQMVSHRYPINFHETSCRALENAFELIGRVTLDNMLYRFSKPFNVAFNACFEFVNLRPKAGSIFEECGIMPFASARITGEKFKVDEDNEQGQIFKDHLNEIGYKDIAINPKFAFGKLVSADYAQLFITELAAWELWVSYEWDSVKAIGGYMTGRFVRPADMSTVSVMQFYKAKNLFKHARETYYQTGTIDNADELLSVNVPEYIVHAMQKGTADDAEVDYMYLRLKADLNALYGIACTNEFRPSTVLDETGIQYDDLQGMCNAPKNPKAWYQFGQRIVGWSRIAQICVMMLARPYIESIVNGDTDSVKFLMDESKLDGLQMALARYSQAIDKGKRDNCARVRKAYPELFDSLEKIGHYVLEFVSKRFCASWNKAYCTHDVDSRTGKRTFDFTLAGIPSRNLKNDDGTIRLQRVNGFADALYNEGRSFTYICNLILGYNVTISHNMTGLNARKFPMWGSYYIDTVTDYLGRSANVYEPAALALYPMDKTMNSTFNFENSANCKIASSNNPNVNQTPVILYNDNMKPCILKVG